jgi:hypothetical protein
MIYVSVSITVWIPAFYNMLQFVALLGMQYRKLGRGEKFSPISPMHIVEAGINYTKVILSFVTYNLGFEFSGYFNTPAWDS